MLFRPITYCWCSYERTGYRTAFLNPCNITENMLLSFFRELRGMYRITYALIEPTREQYFRLCDSYDGIDGFSVYDYATGDCAPNGIEARKIAQRFPGATVTYYMSVIGDELDSGDENLRAKMKRDYNRMCALATVYMNRGVIRHPLDNNIYVCDAYRSG